MDLKFSDKDNAYIINGKKYDPFEAEYHETKYNLSQLHAEMKADPKVKKMVNHLTSYLQNKSFNNGMASSNEGTDMDPKAPREREEQRLDDLAAMLGYRSYL